MINADIILPGTAHNSRLFEIVLQALTTLKETTDARVLYMANNDQGTEYGAKMKAEVQKLGFKYMYVLSKFNISKYFNMGRKLTEHNNRKYIVYACADVKFYPGWLENLLELYEENPHFHSLHPYTYSKIHIGLNYRNDDCQPIKQVIPCDHPGAAGVVVMKREDNHVWDEAFDYWEMDTNWWREMKAKKQMSGVCMNSRVDHVIQGIMGNCDPGYNDHDICGQGREALIKKWGNI